MIIISVQQAQKKVFRSLRTENHDDLLTVLCLDTVKRIRANHFHFLIKNIYLLAGSGRTVGLLIDSFSVTSDFNGMSTICVSFCLSFFAIYNTILINICIKCTVYMLSHCSKVPIMIKKQSYAFSFRALNIIHSHYKWHRFLMLWQPFSGDFSAFGAHFLPSFDLFCFRAFFLFFVFFFRCDWNIKNKNGTCFFYPNPAFP